MPALIRGEREREREREREEEGERKPFILIMELVTSTKCTVNSALL
jgi:hypothetical protein